jgi:hypothetical protein
LTSKEAPDAQEVLDVLPAKGEVPTPFLVILEKLGLTERQGLREALGELEKLALVEHVAGRGWQRRA